MAKHIQIDGIVDMRSM